MDKHTKKKLRRLRMLHSKVDEEFLDKRIEPHLVMFISDDFYE